MLLAPGVHLLERSLVVDREVHICGEVLLAAKREISKIYNIKRKET